MPLRALRAADAWSILSLRSVGDRPARLGVGVGRPGGSALSSRVRTTLIVVGAIVLGIVSRIFYPMESLLIEVAAEPIAFFGGFEFTNSMLVTLVVDLFLIIIAVAATRNMQMVPRGIQNVMEAVIESLFNFFRTINREYTPRAFPILATMFLWIIISNWFGLFPGFGSIGLCYAGTHSSKDISIAVNAPLQDWLPTVNLAEGESKYLGCGPGESIIPLLRAPTADLNTTLALALIAFFYIEYLGFRALGPGYMGKFFNFRGGAVGFIVGIFELISEFARIPAFMFRLFGNIFAGEVLLVVMIFLLPLVLPLPFYLFEVFVGFIQAFIFAVLTIAFISLAVQPHHDEGHSAAHH